MFLRLKFHSVKNSYIFCTMYMRFTCLKPTVCVKKTFPKSFNSIPFRLAKMRTKPECNVAERRPKSFAYRSVSFRFVSFRSVPFCTLGGESRAVQRCSYSSEKSRFAGAPVASQSRWYALAASWRRTEASQSLFQKWA